jgi:hypothetical protein
MIAFSASRRSKNAIRVCFGEALYVPRNFRAKMKRRSERRDTMDGDSEPETENSLLQVVVQVV